MMVADTPDHGISAIAESKARKWRDKIFSKEKESKLSRDAQIDDFLGSSRNLEPRVPSRPNVPSPRLDVSISQRPLDTNPFQSSSDPSPRTQAVTSPVKRRNRKGLKVQFCNEPPKIMGEGGDEADAPTKHMIEVYRSRSNSSASTFTDRSEASPIEEHSPSDTHSYRHALPPSIAIQAQSPISEDPGWRPPLLKTTQDSEFLLSLGETARGSRLSLRASSDPNSFARRVQAKMRADEGRAFQKKFDEGGGDSPTESNAVTPLSGPPQISSAQSPIEDKSNGSFWSSVLSALPEESRPSRLESPSSSIPPSSSTPVNETPTPTTSSSNRPPPYLKSPENSTTSMYSLQGGGGNTESGSKKLRTVTDLVSDTALADFSEYVAQFGQLFSLAAESVKPSMETSLSEWVRACVWWFLKGRGELETFMRSRPSSSGGDTPQAVLEEQSQQAVVNLAKAWWINQTIIPQHPELAKFGRISTDKMLAVAENSGDTRIAHLITLHQSMISHLRGLALSMKRHKILPSATDAPPLSQSIDTSIWVKYPFFAPDISTILSGSISRSMLVDTTTRQPDLGDVMPMGDTSKHFCYGRMFVEAHVSSGEDNSQQIAIPCMLSITRDRTDLNVIATITSQSELVSIVIQGDKKQGPTWADVDWHVRACSMRLKLPRAFELDVHFKQADFKMIWKIVEYSRKVEASLRPEPGEQLIFEEILNVFQYLDPRPTKAFPPEPSPRCRIRLFEKIVKITEGTGTRESHRGYRFIAVTSPKVKTLTSVSHYLGNGNPIIFGYLRGDNGAPALMLKAQDGDALCSMILTFTDAEKRTKMHSLLLGVVPTETEFKTAEIPLKSFSIDKPVESIQSKSPIQFSSPSLTVIDKTSKSADHGYSRTVLSEHLRVFLSANWGSVTDRINIGPGDLQIGLDVNVPTAMAVYRPPQNDLGVAVAENMVPEQLPREITAFLKTMSTIPSVRRYNFGSVKDLHTFQKAITGFTVRFDGLASSFAISRRRMVVPIYKKWEANRTRLQIIQQEKIVQLVAFFTDFSHGKCMNFVLKSTDNFESFQRSGKFGVRIVDAKFALPKGPNDKSADFVCLDMPEYPGEHDDITIYFDSNADQTNFLSALPGSVRSPSRVGSFKR